MRRRTLLLGAFAAAAPASAWAQLNLGPIEPENDLERTFVAALNDPSARPLFRRQLLTAQVALALASSAPDSAPRTVQTPNGASAGAIFTSAARLNGVLGPAAPRAMLTGRAALTRLGAQNVIINFRLIPMLTLEPADVAAILRLSD